MIICAVLSTWFLCFFPVADSKMSELETDVSSRAIWYRSAVCDCSERFVRRARLRAGWSPVWARFCAPVIALGDRPYRPGSAYTASIALCGLGPVLRVRPRTGSSACKTRSFPPSGDHQRASCRHKWLSPCQKLVVSVQTFTSQYSITTLLKISATTFLSLHKRRSPLNVRKSRWAKEHFL